MMRCGADRLQEIGCRYLGDCQRVSSTQIEYSRCGAHFQRHVADDVVFDPRMHVLGPIGYKDHI
jgi:hypothetical protein